MNIKEAKVQIVNAMRAYFTKDEFGNYKISPQAQRPVFLMGPPGIGKTAIMQQVADELGVGLVSYSMTHHTRQSALGLPVIREREYQGKTYSVSEYTMSEIIASVYELMEEGKVSEGILFLDEINCVSETLTPTMLQFLQYKIFGKHKVPDGWLVVAAGNPVEYNRSARDFDIVTWDRLKRIDIEPDYSAWRDYAGNNGVHPAVLSYLDARKENFYKVETGVRGRSFVTARSWVDMSDMIKLYEPLEIPVDNLLVTQYIQDKDIAEDFSIYYDLFNKYKSDYQLEEILSGKTSDAIMIRAKDAGFDERLSLMGLLIDTVNRELREVMDCEGYMTALLNHLKEVKGGAAVSDELQKVETEMVQRERRGTLSIDARYHYEKMIAFLKKHISLKSDFDAIKKDYDGMLAKMKGNNEKAGKRLENLFQFIANAFDNGNEMLILLSNLSANSASAWYISKYGCKSYYMYNDQLLFHKRKLEL